MTDIEVINRDSVFGCEFVTIRICTDNGKEFMSLLCSTDVLEKYVYNLVFWAKTFAESVGTTKTIDWRLTTRLAETLLGIAKQKNLSVDRGTI